MSHILTRVLTRAQPPATRPGRPPKFGRPAHLVALTLPEDVLAALRCIDPDVGWAVVKLIEGAGGPVAANRPPEHDVELLPIAPRRFLIVVRQEAFASLPGVSLVPLGQGKAFLAFPPGRTAESLELALTDQLEDPDLAHQRRSRLQAFRDLLRGWRRDSSLVFHERSIVVVEKKRQRPSVPRS